jgi:hypothetical protein
LGNIRTTIERVALPLANSPGTQEFDLQQITGRRSFVAQVISLWHLASLDAPTVATVWAFAFAHTAQVYLQPWIALLLFCGTWSVYVGDRLLDACRAMRSGQLAALRERHFFHWNHRRSLIPLATISGAMAVGLIVHLMPVVVRERNSVLAAAAVLYFSGVHSPSRIPGWLRRSGLKEMLVGVLFTAGCAAPTLSQMHLNGIDMSRFWPVAICIAYFAALAWCNCRAIDSWESTRIEGDVLLHSALLTIAGVTLAIAFAFNHTDASVLMAAATTSSLLLLLLDRIRFRISGFMLRALADVVLLTPAAVQLFRAFLR